MRDSEGRWVLIPGNKKLDKMPSLVSTLATSGVKIPSGIEDGANIEWLPGGKTANGLQEGALDLQNGNIQFERTD